MSVTGAAASIIIPAQDEEAVLRSCLCSVLLQVDTPPLEIVVVANGCVDRTVDIARAHASLARVRGHELAVVERPVLSKSEALNVGSDASRGDIQIYVDADVVLEPTAIGALIRALHGDAPRLGGLRLFVAPSLDARTRRFFQVWQRLPSVQDQVIGGGVYAVNRAGRARWGKFPQVVADDAFVRTLFSAEERIVADASFLLVPPPSRPELLRMVRRWREGNRQLPLTPERRTELSPSHWRYAYKLGRTPASWSSLPAFLRVLAAVRSARVESPVARWRRTDRGTGVSSRSTPPRVHAVIVTFNSIDWITRCVDALREQVPEQMLSITVVDNASHDGTASEVRSYSERLCLIAHETNLGFARAANVGAMTRPVDTEFVLLLNPDVELAPGALGALISVALRLPGCGLYGGRAQSPQGALDPTCCLARPSMLQALAYAVGIRRFRPLRFLDPDALGLWQRETFRHVPVLTAAVLLVEAEHWELLGGFDEAYFMYGEDVDLNARSAERGGNPLFSPFTRYLHVGGASSDRAQRHLMILRSKVQLYRFTLAPLPAALAVGSLRAGVALRSIHARLSRRSGAPSIWPGIRHTLLVDRVWARKEVELTDVVKARS